MHFLLPTRFNPLLVSIVACHGLTDFKKPKKLWTYALTLLPLPGSLVTFSFLACSIFHFSLDLNLKKSFAFHSFLGCVALAAGREAAFEILMLYMLCVHVPNHYKRVLLDGGGQNFTTASSLMLATLLVSKCEEVQSPLLLSNTHQKLVVAHVLSNVR